MRKAALDNEELTSEDAERGHRGEGEDGEKQHRPAQGQGSDTSADTVHVFRAELADDVARPEERRGLGGGVGEDMQQHPDHRNGCREAHPDGEDAHVFDARIGKKALQVPLAGKVQRREHERGKPEDQKDVAWERRPDRTRGHLVKAQDGVEADGEERSGEQGGHRSGRLRVGVGKPGVHRDESHLRAETEHSQTERQTHDLRRKPRCYREKLGIEDLIGPAEHRTARVVHEDGGQECDAEAHRGDEDVLPRRLKCTVGVADRDQESRDHGRDLDCHPQEG